MTTILWYDLETFGRDKSFDRIAQAAYVRTDLDFQILYSNVLYCRLPEYYLPHPEACLINGLTPQFVNAHGLSESDFAETLRKEFTTKDTIVIGFNNLDFDDKFIRSLFYRTLFNPYEHEWGNTRWDILNLAKATYSLRPDGINWPPLHEQKGYPVFKLTEITKANGINQEGAHDALVDVLATIEVAKLIKGRSPRLYNYYFNTRTKQQIAEALQKPGYEIILHTRFFYNEYWKACTHPLMPIHFDKEKKAVYCYDLLLGIPDSIKDAKEKGALIKIEISKYPFIAPFTTCTDNTFSELGLKKKDIENVRKRILEENVFSDVPAFVKAADEYPESERTQEPSAEVFAFRGAFLPNQFYLNLARIKRDIQTGKRFALPAFENCSYYRELVACFIGNNYPEMLTDEEKALYEKVKDSTLSGTSVNSDKALSINGYKSEIERLRNELEDSDRKAQETLFELEEYLNLLPDV